MHKQGSDTKVAQGGLLSHHTTESMTIPNPSLT